MSSLDSVKGPSAVLSAPPSRLTRAPALLGCRPWVSSRAPALRASSPSAMIASISSGGGPAGVPAAFSRTRYRISRLPVSGGGRVQPQVSEAQPCPGQQHGRGEGEVHDG